MLRCINVKTDYLCKPSANVFGIEFTRFKIRDMESGDVIFEIAKPDNADDIPQETNNDDDDDPRRGRYVRYQFSPKFLDLKSVGAT